MATLNDVPGTETPVAENVPEFILGRKHNCVRITKHSKAHPIIPRHYTMEWRTDMVNRQLINKNAEVSLPHFEHDDDIYYNKREQMHYNVEDRERVDSKYSLPSRTLNPPRHHHSDRYRSSLMTRKA